MRVVLMRHVCGADQVCVLLMRGACVADEVGCVSAARVYNVTVL